MFDTGARPSEIVRQARDGVQTHQGLHWEQVELESSEDALYGRIVIDDPKVEGDGEPLVRLLSSKAQNYLSQLRQVSSGKGSVWPFDSTPVKQVNAIKTDAGVKTSGVLEPFRRGHATRLRELGASVLETAASLGHSDVVTQQKHYTLADRSHQKTALTIIERDNQERGVLAKETG
jgi:integrase